MWFGNVKMRKIYSIVLCFMLTMLLSGCLGMEEDTRSPVDTTVSQDVPYITVNDNVPEFTEDEITTKSFERYADLDELGRCGAAFACVGTDLMPTEKRGNISRIKPSGWHSVRYDNVDGGSLYNRCHLIGFQLSGENANEKNLITGTRYMNVEMIPFEDMVADYVKKTSHHVMYRVTPVFEGKNLIASGVQMEAFSVEDHGKGVSYNVYLYNIQPGIKIDYLTGESIELTENAEEESGTDYVINVNTMKFHLPLCSSVEKMQEKNRENFHGDREELIERGYAPCGTCNP